MKFVESLVVAAVHKSGPTSCCFFNTGERLSGLWVPGRLLEASVAQRAMSFCFVEHVHTSVVYSTHPPNGGQCWCRSRSSSITTWKLALISAACGTFWQLILVSTISLERLKL